MESHSASRTPQSSRLHGQTPDNVAHIDNKFGLHGSVNSLPVCWRLIQTSKGTACQECSVSASTRLSVISIHTYCRRDCNPTFSRGSMLLILNAAATSQGNTPVLVSFLPRQSLPQVMSMGRSTPISAMGCECVSFQWNLTCLAASQHIQKAGLASP